MGYKTITIINKISDERIKEMNHFAYALYFLHATNSESEIAIQEKINNLPNFSVVQSDVNKIKTKINSGVDYVLLETIADLWQCNPNRMLYILYSITPRDFKPNKYLLNLIENERQWYRNYYSENYKKKGMKANVR